MFARYVDFVDDPRDISGTSRFLSGGMGGIASQLSACPRFSGFIPQAALLPP